jgi:hypothetical protein
MRKMRKFLRCHGKIFRILESGNNRMRHLFALSHGIDLLMNLNKNEISQINEESINLPQILKKNILGN